MELDCEDGLELVFTAYLQNIRDEEYQLYLALVPNMDSETFVTFDELYSDDFELKQNKKVDKQDVHDNIAKMFEDGKLDFDI